MAELSMKPVLIRVSARTGGADTAVAHNALDGAVAKGADAKGAAVEGADAKGAVAKGADAKGAVVEGAAVEGAVVEGAIVESPQAEELLASNPTDLVVLQPDDEVETLADRLGQLSIIALNFPAFNDGRPYSAASKLRQQGFEGEIRAIGDVRLDQLEQMARCGFDAFELAAGQNVQLALEQLAGFSHSYQQVADRQPLFRKRQ